ncbi:MAG: hypothetical protein O2970_11535 [Proteobacteria bacterium]|nr:hypothetical protein [Pseudomonadota bacterium]
MKFILSTLLIIVAALTFAAKNIYVSTPKQHKSVLSQQGLTENSTCSDYTKSARSVKQKFIDNQIMDFHLVNENKDNKSFLLDVEEHLRYYFDEVCLDNANLKLAKKINQRLNNYLSQLYKKSSCESYLSKHPLVQKKFLEYAIDKWKVENLNMVNQTSDYSKICKAVSKDKLTINEIYELIASQAITLDDYNRKQKILAMQKSKDEELARKIRESVKQHKIEDEWDSFLSMPAYEQERWACKQFTKTNPNIDWIREDCSHY